ncbi:MAG: GNAT family N-acetyltransferase [Desulfobacteraceae bacterium]|nr:MAG: GNAT family N-acetyltransferase [Desulfobacteraceae bacterium]
MKIINIDGKEFTISGRLIRTLALRDDIIDDVEDPNEIISFCHQKHVPADLLRFAQSIPDFSPKFNYHMDRDAIAAVPISTYENWLTKQVHPNTRNKIRKAEKKGVVVRVERLSRRIAEGIAGIFNETPIRRGRKYSSYGRSVGMVEEEWSRDSKRNEFLVAYYKDEIIGFIQLVYAEKYARTSGTVAKIAHRDKSPMNALFAKAVEVCASRKMQYLVYGRYEYGKKGADSLSLFKRNNGFQKIELPRYFIPLSLRGSVALRLGVQNGLSSAVPGRMMNTLIHLRAAWYGELPAGRRTGVGSAAKRTDGVG